ncbi:hypothetical protein GCM10022220_22980 [Actinocatenispora rupis]|uniref:Uncharacterized protein n=1 Tax=Actinocatenispora rupis TaxID=519421 RepID=A0A8J3J9D5_9ACTN|nr:hypothetical protein Aru02nite_27220 [Actinocatenispora rupis]
MPGEAQGGAAKAEVQSHTGVVCDCADNVGSVVLSPPGADSPFRQDLSVAGTGHPTRAEPVACHRATGTSPRAYGRRQPGDPDTNTAFTTSVHTCALPGMDRDAALPTRELTEPAKHPRCQRRRQVRKSVSTDMKTPLRTNPKGPFSLVAGAGFEPATSGL